MKQIHVVIFGAGGVGQALIRQIVNGRQQLAARNYMQFNVVAVTDSKSWQWQPTGLTDSQLLDIVAAKENGLAVAPEHRERAPSSRVRPGEQQILSIVQGTQLRNLILVDVTAADGMEPVIMQAMAQGFGVVLANKKPLAGPYTTAQPFYNCSALRHESTVGGGQPVIATLRYLIDTNDPIYEIEGQLSGTLGYICTQLDAGVRFSQAVAVARAQGFTEPDPREDLAGMDVMRKVMILGRMAGWPLEAADISVESLYPASMAALSVADFMGQVAQLDAAMARRVETAVSAGQVLRYVAHLTPQKGTVGLRAVTQGSPLANLKYIRFRTGRYNDESLLICGKGAGVEMTAAGVLGDMVGLARELFH